MGPSPFTPAEYQDRLRRVRARMVEAKIDILVVTDVANQHYLTGYDGWSFYTPQIVVVGIEDGPPYWIGRAMDAAGGKLTSWLPKSNIIGWPEDYVQHTARHPMDWVATWMRKCGWGHRRIGVETESYYYSPKSHSRLKSGLAEAAFVRADLLVNWVRAVKSPAEIACMRKAARLAEAAMHAAYDAIAPGVRECDVVAKIQAAQVASQPDYHGDMTALPPTILAGPNASAPHMLWSDRRFVAGEAASLELAGAHRHYNVGLARTIQLGKPAPALEATAAAVNEGMAAALAAVRPGATGTQVEGAWRAVLARHGLRKESRIGYAIGLGYPPDWGEHTISLRPGDTSVLEPGNTLHIILGMWMADWGLEISETVLVTARGAECLTNFPRDVFVKG